MLHSKGYLSILNTIHFFLLFPTLQSTLCPVNCVSMTSIPVLVNATVQQEATSIYHTILSLLRTGYLKNNSKENKICIITINTKHRPCFRSSTITSANVQAFSSLVIVLNSSMVDRGFQPMVGQTKYYELCSCCVYAKHAIKY